MGRSIHRRDFLKTSAAAGAGLWIIGAGPSVRAYAANESINVAIVGAGGQGGGNLNNIAKVDGVNIVGLCDIDEMRLGDAAKKFEKAKTFTDFRKMYDELGKGFDAAVVSTPDHTHAVAANGAMKLGKHVYCEKPLTHSIYEARTLARTAAEMKVATQMGNQGHSNDGSRRTVESIRAGVIGPVTEVHAWTNRPIWDQGIETRPESQPVPKHIHWQEWLGPAPERPYNEKYLPFKWRGWWDFGTGALGDMACHILDVPYWALDLRNPISVEMVDASGRNSETGPKWSITVFQFPYRNGLAPVKLTWYEGGKKPPTELFDGEKVPDGGSLLIGEKGKVFIGDDYGSDFALLPRKDFEGFKAPNPTLTRSPGHHKDFIEACKDPIGRPACSNFAYAAGLTETVLLGVLAQRVGKKLEWDHVNMKATNAPEADPFIKPEFRNGWTL